LLACKHSGTPTIAGWSAINYNNLALLFPSQNTTEPDWDGMLDTCLKIPSTRTRIEKAISHGPHWIVKTRRIISLLENIREKFGACDLEELREWSTPQIKDYLLAFEGIGPKTVSCLLLYQLRRVEFPVDANVLRVGTRLGWYRDIGLQPAEAAGLRDKRSFKIATRPIPDVATSPSQAQSFPGNVAASSTAAPPAKLSPQTNSSQPVECKGE
jgi:hypothetical protein